MTVDFVPLRCPEFRKRVARNYSCSNDKKPLPCLHCNRSSEIITSREYEMIERGLGKAEIDNAGNMVVIL